MIKNYNLFGRCLVFAVLYLGLSGANSASDSHKFDLLITNARVIVGDGRVLENSSVGIVGKQIEWVGPTESHSKDAEIVINGAGLTLLPGLIDVHVHLIDPEYVNDRDSLRSYMAVTLPHWLNGMLQHGVTTIRSLGDPIDESLEIKNKVAAGLIAGPRIIASGPGLTSPNGHPAVTMFGHYPEMRKSFVRVASSPDEARAVIGEIAKAGMSSPLKLVYDGGEPGGDVQVFMGRPIIRLETEVLKAAIEEAHSLNYRVSIHTRDYEGALNAVLAGADGLEHGAVLTAMPDDRLLNAMFENGTFLVSTLRLQVKNDTGLLAVASDNLRRLHEGGVIIVVGSETPVGWTYPGLDTLYEIELLVRAGLNPLAAIQAATFNAARSLEIDGQLGSIRKGMLADMLIVRGNALEDISVIRYPSYVIQNGRVVRGLE